MKNYNYKQIEFSKKMLLKPDFVHYRLQTNKFTKKMVRHENFWIKISQLITFLNLIFLYSADLPTTDIYRLWKFDLSNFHTSLDTAILQTFGQTDYRSLAPKKVPLPVVTHCVRNHKKAKDVFKRSFVKPLHDRDMLAVIKKIMTSHSRSFSLNR